VAAAADGAAASGRDVTSCSDSTGKRWKAAAVADVAGARWVAERMWRRQAGKHWQGPRPGHHAKSADLRIDADRAATPGFVSAGKPLFRSGCTVLWHLSKNLVEWEIYSSQSLPIAVCGRADVAPATRSKCDVNTMRSRYKRIGWK